MAEVIVLQHADSEGLGTIQHVLAQHSVKVRTVRSYAGEQVPEQMEEASGLIVMGGPMGVYQQEEYPFLKDELRLIEQALVHNKSVLGVCLGSQLLATVPGGAVITGPQKEIGWYPVRLTTEAKEDALWAGVTEEFTAFHWHGDVFTLPSGAVPLAYSGLTERQAFRYGQNAYGFLFHLEVTAAQIQSMVTSFSNEMQEAGVTSTEIARGSAEYMPVLRTVGMTVFDRWVRRLN